MALAYNGLNARTCRRCGYEKSRVFDSRNDNDLLKRRRECLNCGFRWSTVEIEEFTFDNLIVEDERRASEALQQVYLNAIARDKENELCT